MSFGEGATAVALRAWLTTKLRTAADITVSAVSISPAPDGTKTVRFAAAWEDQGELLSADLVAKVAAARGPDPGSNLETEFLVLQMLAEAGLPAPTPWWFEGDFSVLGGPFLVFDCSRGRAGHGPPPPIRDENPRRSSLAR
jgi:aminoglycoside phosphotransferase (APT) family kinase protein